MNGHSHPEPDSAGVARSAHPVENTTVGAADPSMDSMRCPTAPDLCERCQHAMDPHVVVATGPTPMDGGIILCPESGCTCWFSWCPPDMDCQRIRIPDLAETDELRRDIQQS